MKVLIALSLFLTFFQVRSQAQDVYNLVLENATKIVNTPTANFAQTRIAQFKCAALIYMKAKAIEQHSEVTESFLNTQAYYLSEFLTIFFEEALKDRKLGEEERKDKIRMFMACSINNPLFGDNDEGKTLSYIRGGGELTPFSLDTNWQTAYEQAKSQL